MSRQIEITPGPPVKMPRRLYTPGIYRIPEDIPERIIAEFPKGRVREVAADPPRFRGRTKQPAPENKGLELG